MQPNAQHVFTRRKPFTQSCRGRSTYILAANRCFTLFFPADHESKTSIKIRCNQRCQHRDETVQPKAQHVSILRTAFAQPHRGRSTYILAATKIIAQVDYLTDPRARPQQQQQMPSQPEPESPSTLDLESLLAEASAAGLLPPTPTADDAPHSLAGGGGGAAAAGAAAAGAAAVSVVLIGFSAEDQKKRHPGVIEALYDSRPKKCEQCGLRFLSSEGKQHDAHMDWHYRERQSTKQLDRHFRGWQYTLELWLTLNDVREDEQQEEIKSFFASEAGGSAAAEDNVVQEVLVGDDKVADCGICGERLNATFDADEEEWMYKGAIRSEGILYHAACVKNQESAPKPAGNDESAAQPKLELESGTSAAAGEEAAAAAAAGGGDADLHEAEGVAPEVEKGDEATKDEGEEKDTSDERPAKKAKIVVA